ncbi:hypothetical protein [Actinoplanes sp. GCM10030250]|uniref:hypothetical protein n=1 Tax=Actinoplanes sp. GCM10030250 TaxID=3273376 RepID=UPI00360CC7C0
MAVRLDFLGWRRSATYTSVLSPALTAQGRLTGRVDLTLRNTEPPNEVESAGLTFDLLGPGDVKGFKPFAVRHEVPSPGITDFEETKCVYVELSGPDLPWRYTPELAAARRLRPWIVLVVGTTTEVVLQPGGTVTIGAGALGAHNLDHAARWAHVQDDVDHPGERLVARLLSPRDLAQRTHYIAVVVPAFAPNGQPAWVAGTPSVTLPAYHSWEFATGEEGDFPTLAARLRVGTMKPGFGRAALDYTPLAGDEGLSVRGALAPIGSIDAAVPGPVAADVTELTEPLLDPRRPVITLPGYGEAWRAEPDLTEWGGQFRVDPRHRAVAGLGLKAGIDFQDLLSDAASAQAGALEEAAALVRHLTAGLGASASLWTNRLPADPIRRLAVFGPALARLPTTTGSVLDRITGPGRPLPPAIFSAAARRVLRGATDPRDALEAANSCPPPPPRAPRGLPHDDHLSKSTGVPGLDEAMARAAEAGRAPFTGLKDLVDAFDRRPYSDQTVNLFERAMAHWVAAAADGRPIPLLALLAILDPPDAKQLDERQLIAALRRIQEGDGDTDSVIDLVVEVSTRPPDRPCRPIDLGAVAEVVGAAIDPTAGRPFVVDRVLDLIAGLDDQPLTPPELCPDLDIPAWQMLRDRDPDWLLPGAGTMESDRVVAVQTNPAFVDAFLLGLNTQTIGELRFRNIPIRTGCTPLRQFWARTNPATESYDDDIVGVHRWPDAGPLGSPDHQTAAAAGADLVIVFRTTLFRRYPRTLVYLTPAPLAGGQPDWEADPDLSQRLLPVFQGALTPEIVFFGFDLEPALGRGHWVVLEEPPHGVQFFSGPTPGMSAARAEVLTQPGAHPDGAAFADAAFADPYRVMIRGVALIGSTP